MGRGDSWQYRARERELAAKKQLNPVWRGVGCIMVVTLSMIGWFLAGWFVRANAENGWIYIPAEVINPSIASLIDPYIGQGRLVQVVVAFIVLLMSFGVINFAYAILFPIRPGETDVPPLKRRRRRRR